MKYNLKDSIFYLAAILISACNPFQQVKDAAKAIKTSDSIMTEFNKVNEEIKQANESFKKSTDSLEQHYDSISAKVSMPGEIQRNKGTGAIQ
ncbi:MAG TPA: hypothetical protein VF008_24255 [Niastella sp.]